MITATSTTGTKTFTITAEGIMAILTDCLKNNGTFTYGTEYASFHARGTTYHIGGLSVQSSTVLASQALRMGIREYLPTRRTDSLLSTPPVPSRFNHLEL